MPIPNLLNGDSSFLRVLSDEEVAFLERHPDLPNSQNWMSEVRISRQLISCHCGRLLHVVERKELYFLRRNPNQDFDDEVQCEICTFEIQAGKYRGGREPYQPNGYSLLLRVQPERSGDGDGEKRAHTETIKNKLMFLTLHRLMTESDLTLYAPGKTPTGSNAHFLFWTRFKTALGRIKVPRTRQTMLEFSWLPLKDFSGGLKGLNDRLLNWERLDVPPEAWLFAQMLNSPVENTAFFYSSPVIESKPRFKPYRAVFKQDAMSRIGTVGPWVLFGVGTHNSYDDPDFALPTFKKAVLQMIVANDWPMPVENSSERELALALRERNVPFVKGVFDDNCGLRPDFAIPDSGTLIIVDGSPVEEVRQEKLKVLNRLKQVYRDRKIFLWEAFGGQELDDFLKEIGLK